MSLRTPLSRAVLAAACLSAVLAAAGEPDRDLALLLDGVDRIAAPRIPGPLCVFGDRALAVVTGKSGEGARDAVVAAARLGDGRVVAFGHDGYFDAATLKSAATGRLMLNAVLWAGVASGKARPRIAVLGQPGLLGFLTENSLPAEDLGGTGWRGRLGGFHVLCANPVRLDGGDDAAAVAEFVRKGGGLIAVGLGWGWGQLNPTKDLVTDHPASRLLAPAGIVWADGTLDPTAEGGYAAGSPPPPLVHANRALDAILSDAAGTKKLAGADLRQAVHAVSLAARSLPDGDRLLLPRLRALDRERQAEAVPSEKKPVRADQPLARLLLTLQSEDARRLPPEKVRAHPAAAEFPGPVSAEAPRVERTVEVDTAVPDWHSTGLYAPPGEVVTVTVPEAVVPGKLAVRIGAHADSLWHLDRWRRCPEVCRQFTIAAASTRIAGAFGGPIYIVVPRGCRLGSVPVTIAGAVEAPLFVRGRTDAGEWRRTIRGRPAPWAELATDKLVLTVPSKVVRGLDDPEAVLAFWDRVLDACADLAALPARRERPERFVTDVQISAGYMHSGYPLMTLLDMPEVLVDVPRIVSNGHGGVWGLFHELGHNHQSGDWTFEGTGEVTVNLFTMYVFETVCGLPAAKAHGGISGAERARKLKAYCAAPGFEAWKRDPFLALILYLQVREAFGWDAYKKVFAEYRALPRRERPRTDAEKRDQWMVRLSRAVGRNLGPFFEAWAVPTSSAARASIAGLPAWMPEGFPPKP
jgi:hypothetical protein